MSSILSSSVRSGAGQALLSVLQRIRSVSSRLSLPREPVLLAVSKTKPVSQLLEVYETKHRDFGENYVQELLDKSPEMPQDIRWHFIGHLQSNKCNRLVKGVPSLYMVHTVDSEKLAKSLNRACINAGRDKLKVMVQVNTSGEACM
jgi:PLP dependent protein